MIDEEVRQIIEPELMIDEKLIWTGKPMRFPIKYDGFFGIAFLILWVVITFRSPDVPILFTIVGLLGLLSAINYVLEPNREAYALTDKRVIIKRNLFLKRMLTLPFDRLSRVNAAYHKRYASVQFVPGGKGTFSIGEYNTTFRNNNRTVGPKGLIFQNIRDPKIIINHLREIRSAGATP